MKCTVCGGDRFVNSEYQMDTGSAPALECVSCGALNLDESAAQSEEDRASVRLAVAVRAAAQYVPESK
jgi:hypothetical protein